MPEEPARRPLRVDISTLDLVHARTEALRLLASAETDLDVHLTEAARVLTDLFDGLDLDAVEDAELSTLTHRVLEIVAGLMMVASRSREDQRSPPRRWDERPAYRRHAAGAGTPWPIRFYFLNISDDEHPEHREYLHVGFELGEHFASERGTPLVPLAEEPEPLDPIAVQRIASNYASYLEVARHAIVLDQEGMTGAIQRLRPGRKPARLTDDFYRLIADDFRARREVTSAPLKELAAAQHVDISTASRWVKEARRRGYLEAANG